MEAPRQTIERAHELRRKLTPHPIGPYILDFYCDTAKLAVEVDGQGHLGRVEHDERRDRWLLAQGIRTLRIPAISVRDNLDGVVTMICAAAASEFSQ